MPSKFVEIVPPSHRKGTVSPLQPSDGMILVVGTRDELRDGLYSHRESIRAEVIAEEIEAYFGPANKGLVGT